MALHTPGDEAASRAFGRLSTSKLVSYHGDLHEVKRNFSSRKVFKYFAFSLTYELLVPLSSVLFSCLGALFVSFYFGWSVQLSYQPFTPMQVVLGFLTGFYLNHAFDRNSAALEAVTTMSVRLRSCADRILSFIFTQYLKHPNKSMILPQQKRIIISSAVEIVAVLKYYFICCCLDLNAASLIKEADSTKEDQKQCLSRWKDVVESNVILSDRARIQIELLTKHFSSGVHFDLLAGSWINEVLSRVSPSEDKFFESSQSVTNENVLREYKNKNISPTTFDSTSPLDCPSSSTTNSHQTPIDKPVHWPDRSSGIDYQKTEILLNLQKNWLTTRDEVEDHLSSSRNKFLEAHAIANGRTSPVHFWLLGLLMYLLCCCMPWVIVKEYQLFCIVPSLLLAYIFFGARQIGADFWEPFGRDAEGLVDIDLQASCQQFCSAVDKMIEYYTQMMKLCKSYDENGQRHKTIMRLKKQN